MGEVVCVRVRLKPGSLARVEEWARTLRERREEALETLRLEGVTVESVFLEHAPDGDHLIYYMRAQDLERAYRVGRELAHDIQRYHEAFKRDAFDARTTLRLLVDLERDG